jgi:hypothetical protein
MFKVRNLRPELSASVMKSTDHTWLAATASGGSRRKVVFKDVENGFIESFNGRLRNECLNVEWFVSLADARQKLAKFRQHYNHERPHSSLADRTPAAFAELHRRVTEKASTSMGRTLQSLFIESLECAKPA